MNIPEIFAKDVFNSAVMEKRLPKDVYRALRETIDEGKSLDISTANVIAAAMRDWAVENGATHYTHWFQPMTGITAEKHDSFIAPTDDAHVIMEFSGKKLIKGEADASSFPSGGLRATFEARGYTAWDPTSYAFIKNHTLCIPTAFCSYGGDALDKRTPLLRSMETLNKAALRVLKLLGSDAKRVIPYVGAEQEYFLIDREMYSKRKDLIYTARSLYGAKPPKTQELDDHYFGTIKMRVQAYMEDLDEQLWRLGVPAKTKHNEVAPAQHELAPVFSIANIATDHNQLTMEIMKRTARRHKFKCLLSEKPFDYVNGSGKHINWSLSTNTGVNLLNPGKTPAENAQFLIFLTAVIKAVYLHQDLLRLSVASAGNDHRLGGSEAPPAIISIFLGDELTAILDAIVKGEHYHESGRQYMKIGVDIIPDFVKDTTDRNRTSPFAFTGNKFEFRSPGSKLSVAGPTTFINTIVADVLDEFADKLEGAQDINEAITRLIRDTVKESSAIIFNGDGYSKEWAEEAKKRGLVDLPTTPDALPHFADKKNVELFERHRVYTETEIHSRVEILLDEYIKTIRIEANTMLDMANKDIFPAVTECIRDYAQTAQLAASCNAACDYQTETVKKLTDLMSQMYAAYKELKTYADELTAYTDYEKTACFCRDKVLPAMKALRTPADELESLVGSKYWPYPTYGEMLFYV